MESPCGCEGHARGGGTLSEPAAVPVEPVEDEQPAQTATLEQLAQIAVSDNDCPDAHSYMF